MTELECVRAKKNRPRPPGRADVEGGRPLVLSWRRRAGPKDLGRFLGVNPSDGLAGESFDESNLGEIDLSRFDIARQATELAEVVGARRWGTNSGIPDTEFQRNNNLDFSSILSRRCADGPLEIDSAGVHTGIPERPLSHQSGVVQPDRRDCRRVRGRAGTLFIGTVTACAAVRPRSRTIRNQAGPAKPLRTTAERQLRRERTINDPAFVTVHTFDAVDWLRRRGFEFQPLNLNWARARIDEAPASAIRTRSLLMLALVNTGPRTSIGSILTCTEDQVRRLEDGAEPLAPNDEQRLRTALGI